MVKPSKVAYDRKLCGLLDEYTQILIVGIDNVSSRQLQEVRKGLRSHSVVLMGKNTMMRRSVKLHAERTGNSAFLSLIPLIVGKVGLIFTKGDLKEVKEEVTRHKVGVAAQAGRVAPVDVVIYGNTGLEPTQTSFFQVLNIPTRINRGGVEIINPVHIVKKGEKVGSNEAALLGKMQITPFSYGVVVLSVYDNGSVFSPDVLEMTQDDLVDKFSLGVSLLASLSLAISYPTLPAAIHFFINAYNNVLAVAVATAYSFPLAERVKELVKVSDETAVAAADHVAASEGELGDDEVGSDGEDYVRVEQPKASDEDEYVIVEESDTEAMED